MAKNFFLKKQEVDGLHCDLIYKYSCIINLIPPFCASIWNSLVDFLNAVHNIFSSWGHPKFYFFDAGIFRANRPAGPLAAPSEIDGAALEGLVAQHLRAWCDYSSGNHSLHYWQTRSRLEIDFVVYGESGLYAVEVKNSSQIRPDSLRGLEHFAEDYPESRRFLLYRGRERIMRNGILCLPCDDFLKTLTPNKPISGDA